MRTVDDLFANDGEWLSMSGVLFDLDGRTRTLSETRAAFNVLPDHIQAEALAWGLSDTEFRESVYLYFKRHGIPTPKADGGTPCPTP